MNDPRIGLALSGGGSRATCFGLGCLRALHDKDLLRHLTAVSGISGGSLLTALYAYGPSDFAAFDGLVVAQLRRGLQIEILLRSVRPDSIARNLTRAGSAAVPRRRGEPPVLRSANRTDGLREALASRVFGTRSMQDLTHPHLATVITATDLKTTNAVRFGSLRSSCSVYGIIEQPVLVADAVAASAAFPLLLPAMERRFTFRREPDAPPEEQTVLLSDGGVYDNLALSVLEPGRSSAHTAHTYEVDYLISCDAGRGRLQTFSGHFAPARLRRSFEAVHRRAQDAARGRLHEAAEAGRVRGFVQAYLGMDDTRLPVPVADLVPAEEIRSYPTDFRAMADTDIDAISLRGEQLTRTLLAHYCPDLH